ncbi:hypothetical protein PISL3812_07880 [Talaromyces islandicus]|uniref:HTH APSES-type domain-containing protein n=1 Tax=Talaromyces islandicus TaxID=28573 RepID=A0A0U1M5J0_TALIS|nr:hypothetical protein PISL3812_07880 [Talaromyces islandicus]
MASIESLLNPAPPEPVKRHSELQGKLQHHHHHQQHNTFPPDISDRRPPRIPKDAPVFNPGKVRGELRYPPFEERDEFLDSQHVLFEIHPTIGHIAEFPRHIPYSSEKKGFLEKTGRESFEVFQYTFKIPNVDKAWTVMWDYNIGLVRTTHLFKCNEYSKTTPAKMLNANPGLREICHSITGGALAAQGYWMPYEAAKAVSATFCWGIRYALTPLFGRDFPSMCVPPESPQFGKMIVDPEIVRRSTETANQYRRQELELKMQAQQQQQRQWQRRQGQPAPMEVSSFMRDDFRSPTSSKGAVDTGRAEEDYCFPNPTTTTTTTVSDNPWTPINTLLTERAALVRRSGKRTMTAGTLPPIENLFHTHAKGSPPSQMNPLKRRLNENNPENAESASSTTAAAAAGKSCREVHPARKTYSYDGSSDEDDDDDDDDDDDINLDLTTDDDGSSGSDSDADLGIISDLSMLTSSDSDGEGNNAERRRHRRRSGYPKPQQQMKNKSHDNLSSTTSPPPPQPPRPKNSPLLSKQNHHSRDREAAETLLALSSRSGSSSVEETPADAEKETKKGQDQELGHGTADSKEHAIKRLRRMSF